MKAYNEGMDLWDWILKYEDAESVKEFAERKLKNTSWWRFNRRRFLKQQIQKLK